MTAEATRSVVGGRQSNQFRLSSFECELFLWGTEPRYEGGTVDAAAHGAVAVAAKERREQDGETHGSAEAATGNGLALGHESP